jgi:hypothetical protein
MSTKGQTSKNPPSTQKGQPSKQGPSSGKAPNKK